MSAKLEALLEAFKMEMLDKFWARRERALKRWGTSVTDDAFDWSNLDALQIEGHMREEIAEWMEDDGPNRIIEDVDVASMAFLDWVVRTRKA